MKQVVDQLVASIRSMSRQARFTLLVLVAVLLATPFYLLGVSLAETFFSSYILAS